MTRADRKKYEGDGFTFSRDPFEEWLNLPPWDTRTVQELAGGEPAPPKPDEWERRDMGDSTIAAESRLMISQAELGAALKETYAKIFTPMFPPTSEIAKVYERCPECGISQQKVTTHRDIERAEYVTHFATCGHRVVLEEFDLLQRMRHRR